MTELKTYTYTGESLLRLLEIKGKLELMCTMNDNSELLILVRE